MKTKIKETIFGHIKAIEKQLEELDESPVESSDTASPLTPADLRARALAGKTMYFDFEESGEKYCGSVLILDSDACKKLFQRRAVFIDGDKAYRENGEKEDAPSHLQLRVGGLYLTRGGGRIRIIEQDYDPYYPFNGDNGHCYMENGREWSENIDTEYDLIKEI